MITAARMTWTPALRVVAGCAALALLGDVALVARALRSRDEMAVTPLRMQTVTPIAARPADALGLIGSARARRPFEPLGATESLASAAIVIPQAMPMRAPQPRLIGTVVGETDSFVMMAMPDGAIRSVRVGERAGALKLRSVSAGGAVFDDIHGDRVTLRSPTPGSDPQP